MMGGLGSGGWNRTGRGTVEEHLMLEVGRLRRAGVLMDGRREPFVYPFEVPHPRYALGCVEDIGFGELAIRAALWPTDDADRWLRVVADPAFGLRAGAAFAAGWLERRKGRHLQSSPSLFRCRELVLASLAQARVEPLGYADAGEVIP
jgi:hypothetical protein